MRVDDTLPSFSFCCASSDGPSFLHNSHGQSERDPMNHSDLTPYGNTPIALATTQHSRSLGDCASLVQMFPGAVNQDYAQQPPDHMINYWFHRLGLSLDTNLAETPLNLPTLPSAFSWSDYTGPSAPLRTPNPRAIAPKSPVISISESQRPSAYFLSLPHRPDYKGPQTRGVVRRQPPVVHSQGRSKCRVYDRPGKKPAAEYEPDPLKLQTLCQLRGGTDFACQWIPTVFKNGVTLEALIRPLEFTEIESMNFPGGFAPSLAYDGFLKKAGDGVECCLCAADRRTWWKNKKDAVRHLRKFHFGLADQCGTCHKCIYSTGEMTSHRCTPLQNPATPGTAMGPETNTGSSLYRTPN